VTDDGRLARAAERVLRGVPGVAFAVVDANGTRVSRGAGFADLATHTPARPSMICPWFSMTKIVTATLAVRAAEQGLLDLDQPVRPLVPAMRHLKPADAAGRITARHLLSHTAGLVNPLPLAWIHPAGEPGPDPARFLDDRLARNPRLAAAQGGRSRYSNLGILVMGEALAAVHRMPYVDLVRRVVIEPLGLGRTDFVYRPDMLEHAATGYHPRFDPMRLLVPRWVQGPAIGRWIALRRCLLDGSAYGGLVGSLDDAARFLRVHLNDGELDGVRLVSARGAVAMRTITSPGERFDLGLGWFRPVKRRDTRPAFVEHLGGGAGFYNVIRLYPDPGVGIAVMGNATSYDLDALADRAPEVGS
jgi:CubicO group peptidase (beta-lactamase class C family)